MSIKSIRSILDIATEFDALVLDMYGVIWEGTRFFDGVLNTLTTLKKQGKRIFVLSNTTEPQSRATEKYARFGLHIGTHYDGFLSSSSILDDAAQHGFFERLTGKTDYHFYVIGYKSELLFQDLAPHITSDMRAADFVYLASPSTWEKQALDLNHLLPEMKAAAELGLPAVLANPDYYAFRGEVKYCTQGLMGKWYEDHGGHVTWVGKPFPLVYDYALRQVNLPPERCLMVGDTLRTDIVGGHNAGMKTLLVTGTGMTADEVKSGQSLEMLCRENDVFPDYLIERFC